MAGDPKFPLKPVGSVAKVRSGYAFKSNDMGSAGFPIVKIRNVVPPTVDISDCQRVPEAVIAGIPDIERFELTEGDALIALTGATVGKVGRFPRTRQRHFLNQRVGKLYLTRPESADYRYLYYVLSQDVYVRQMFGIADGSAQANISGSQIERLEIPLPPLKEQQAIACILGALDDKIELNRRMNRTLEEMARAIFKSWFIDFDPVRWNAARKRNQPSPGLRPPSPTGRRAGGEGAQHSLKPDLAALFPDTFEDSELGEIPRGWEVGTLGDVAEHPRRGVQPDQMNPATPYIALEHMPKRCIALSDWGTAEGVESNKCGFRIGEILFGKLRPYFHKVGVAPVNGVCSTDIVVVAPRSAHWFGYVLGHMSSDAFVEYTNACSTGTKMPRTSWGDMSRYSVVVPSELIAEAFTNQVRPAVDRIIAGIHESRTLAALRDALLPKLMSGELRVPDAVKLVEASI